MFTKDQAESASDALLQEPRAQQIKHAQRQVQSRASRKKWLPIGALMGLVAGWTFGEIMTGQAFPSALVGIAIGGVIGTWCDRRSV